MKITHNYTPRTEPSAQGLAEFQVQYNPNMFGAGLGQALQGFGAALQVSRERQDQNKNFDNLINFTDFETKIKLDLENLKRDSTIDDATFFERADALYTNAQNEFLNGLKDQPKAQKEFEYRAAQVKQGVLFDVYKFDFNKKDLFYSTEINKHLTQAQNELAANPGILEQKRDIITSMIQSSGLPEAEKAKQIDLANRALESITYRAEAKAIEGKRLQSPARNAIVAQDLPAQAGGVLNAIADGESAGKYDIRFDGSKGGGKVNSYADHPRVKSKVPWSGEYSSAAGKYMFIEGTWDTAAKAVGATDFSPANQDRAAWYWAQKTYKDVKGGDLNEAIAAGKFSDIKAALGTQWAAVRTMPLDKFVRLFNEGSGQYGEYNALNNDPSFANLSLADRESLQRDARGQATDEYGTLLKQQQEQYNTDYNALLTGLYDGTQLQSSIDQFRQDHPGMDFNDIKKAQDTLDARLGDNKAFVEGSAKLDAGDLWVQGNAEDTKRANALFNRGGGADALQKGDQAYVDNTLIPRWQKMNYAAPDMANMLMAMTRGQDASKAAFAFSTLARMRETAPSAFDSTFSPAEQAQVDFFTSRQNYYAPEDVVNQMQNRGRDQAVIQSERVLREEAKKLITDNKGNFPSPVSFYSSYIPGGSAYAPVSAEANALLTKEYNALLEDNLVKYQLDKDQAVEATRKQLARVWSTTTIGGNLRIARFPPEVAGYEPINGSFDWIDHAVRKELNLSTAASGFTPQKNQVFELISDATTEHEIMQRFAEKKDTSLLRPLQGNERRANPDGSYSTEITTTWQLPSGKWVNVPSLWMDQNGKFKQFAPNDEEGILNALKDYEEGGKQAPRYNSEAEAVAAAKARSQAGGAGAGPLFQSNLTRPSYLVYTTDEYGVPHIATDDKGQILRIDFVPDPADIQAQQEDWQKRNEIAARDTALQRWEKLSGNGIVDRAKELLGLSRPLTPDEEQELKMLDEIAPGLQQQKTEDQGAYIRKQLEDQHFAITGITPAQPINSVADLERQINAAQQGVKDTQAQLEKGNLSRYEQLTLENQLKRSQDYLNMLLQRKGQ